MTTSTSPPTTASPTAMAASQRPTQAELSAERLAYNVREFCKAVGVGQTKVYAEMKAGRLKSVMVAGRRLILRVDAMEWLEAGRKPATVQKPP